MELLITTQEPFLICYFIIVAFLLFVGGCYLLKWLFDVVEGWWINRNQKGVIGRALK